MADQNCTTLEEIALGCHRNSGGMFKFYAGDMEDISAITENASTWMVSAMTVSVAPVDITIKRKTSNYTEVETQDLGGAGSVEVVQTVNLMIPRREAAKSRALNIMGSGQRYLYGIVKDANGKYWYIPYLQLSSTGEGSGTERKDGSKYSVVLLADSDHLAYEIDSAVVASILAVS